MEEEGSGFYSAYEAKEVMIFTIKRENSYICTEKNNSV